MNYPQDVQTNIKKFLHFFFSSNINFDDKKINNSNFCRNKKLFKKDDMDVNKILISKKALFKYFIGYNNNEDIRPLCMKLPQMIGYVKCFDSNQTFMYKASSNYWIC